MNTNIDIKKIEIIVKKLEKFFVENQCNKAEIYLVMNFFKNASEKQAMLILLKDMGIITETTLKDGFESLKEMSNKK